MVFCRVRRSRVWWLGWLVAGWSVLLGWGMAQAQLPTPASRASIEVPPNGTVDVVPPNLQFGQALYLETCATCHVGVPPAVMPTETWKALIADAETYTDHYGVPIQIPGDPGRLIMWNYLSTFSRPLREGEEPPFRLRLSRYFRALHPKVEFTQPIALANCATCHIGADRFDFRSLAPEWQDAP